MSAILTIEGPAGFGFDPALLEDLYKVGFRISTLGWNEKNVLCGSHKTGGGLTDLGKEYVKEAQRLGMIIDVSHISDEAFWDIMKITEAPIIATHSNSRAVWDCSRNLTDDMFRAICETGGVAGFNQFAYFVGENADMDKVSEHFLHFMDLDPSCKHIALGGDLDGCDVLPNGFHGVQDYPKLAQKLLACGLNEQNVMDIFWNNPLGVMRKCCM
jgi:membrane dipeptidase